MTEDEPLTTFGTVLTGKVDIIRQAGIMRLSVALLGLVAAFDSANGQVVADARSVVTDPDAVVADRVRALQHLARGHNNSQDDVRFLAGLLDLRTPLEVQLAAVDLLAARPGEQGTRLLLSNWTNHGPRVHTAVVSHLLWREPWREALDRKADDQTDLAASLVWARRDITQRHLSTKVRMQAQRLLDESSKIDPQIQVSLEKFLPCLWLPGDAERGQRVFDEATCSNCHRLNGVGQHVAQDLSSLTDKSARSLFIHTIDPNRYVDHQYLEYVVFLDKGPQIAGMLLDEATDSITFADINGQSRLVKRAEIDLYQCNNWSHMPYGLEARLTLQQMADLLAFMTAAVPESAGQ